VIAVVIPVLGRPEASAPLVENIRETSTHVTRVLFLYTPGDSQEEVVQRLWREGEGFVLCSSVAPLAPGDYARKINAGFALTAEPFVFLGASDLLFHQGWDEAALRVAEETGAGVIGTDDMANPAVRRGTHSTHPLVRRSYIEGVGGTFDQGPGVVYYEGYDHQAVDNELCYAATKRNEWAFAKESRVQHRHPIFDKSVGMDDTYRRALARGKEDIRLLRERMASFNEGRVPA
jgi:hypothetical protein